MNKNPSEYEGNILKQNEMFRSYLKFVLPILRNVEFEKIHDGPCSPMSTPCDGSCSHAYYYYKLLDEIEFEITPKASPNVLDDGSPDTNTQPTR